MAERRESTQRDAGQYGACQRCGERPATTRVIVFHGLPAGQPVQAPGSELFLCDECARALRQVGPP
jgi:hypothetical protein